MSEQGEQTNHLDIDGCFNVRDAGGWPTDDGRRMASGKLYRADDPVRLSEEGRARIAGLGLRAVIDLRQQAQFDPRPRSGPPRSPTIPTVDRIIDVDNPRFEQATDIVGFYEDMVERGPQLVGRRHRRRAHRRGSGARALRTRRESIGRASWWR